MAKSSTAIIFAATLLYNGDVFIGRVENRTVNVASWPDENVIVLSAECTFVVAYCASYDYTDYNDGIILCNEDKKTMKLGYIISEGHKNCLEVTNFKNRRNVDMFVRIANKYDDEDVREAQSEYEDWKKKIEEKHPDTVSSKSGQIDRRVIGIPGFGFGYLKKPGQKTANCYYYVIEYADDYSDYIGGSIVPEDGNPIELDDGSTRWRSEFNHTFKVATILGKNVRDTYARIAPLSDFESVVSTIGDWDSITQEIENQDTVSYNVENEELNKRPLSILSEGNAMLKKDGKADVPCYHFVFHYSAQGKLARQQKKAATKSKK